MEARRFRRKLAGVEAFQLIDDLANHCAAVNWVIGNGGKVEFPMLAPCLFIQTPDGNKRADIGDWIVRDDEGRFHVFGPSFVDEFKPA